MEQQQIRTSGFPVRGDAGDKLRLVPLVHQNEIRTLQCPIDIEPSRVIDCQRQWRVGLAPGLESGRASVL